MSRCPKTVIWFALISAMLCVESAMAQVVWHVDANATAAVRDGTTWCMAFGRLEEALAVATAGDEIRVADGVYTPDPGGHSDPRDAAFQLTVDVPLKGGYAGCQGSNPDARDPAAFETILSGDLNDDDVLLGNQTACEDVDGTWYGTLCDRIVNNDENCYHVLLSADSDAEVSGFTISDGHANGAGLGASPDSRDQGSGLNVYRGHPRIIDCMFRNNRANNHGALNDHNGATIIRCTFRSNFAIRWGGAVHNHRHHTSTLTDCRFYDNATAGTAAGGGALFSFGTTNITNTLFSGNASATNGGALYFDEGSISHVVDCTFLDNTATNTAGNGGAVYNTSDGLTMDGCVFERNSADYNGAGIYNSAGYGNDAAVAATITGCTFSQNTSRGGAGIYNQDAVARLTSCTFSRNVTRIGGGVYNVQFANRGRLLVDHCRFLGNTNSISGGGSGAGLYTYGGHPTLTNCLFSGNSVGYSGGGVYIAAGSPTVTNCTFSRNHADRFTGGLFYASPDGLARVFNCVFWGNSSGESSIQAAQIGLQRSVLRINYSDVQGWTGSLGGTGNIGANPQFVDAIGPDGTDGTEDDDLRLSPGSPGIDAGANIVPGSTAFDLDGRPRFIDILDDEDTGTGIPPLVDMGAYEHLVDCNGNGTEDQTDLVQGASADCNANGIPDECEDCNGNGLADECDLAAGTGEDCTANGILDACEPDCNQNGTTDSCDIEALTAPDCNDNAIPDECDVVRDGDCNSNGVPDECDLAAGASPDCNKNHVPDECDPDCNANGVPDDCDLAAQTVVDCNANLRPDFCDVKSGASADCSGNGIPDECETDCNGNGGADSCDVVDGTSDDCNDNEVPDECEADEDCNGNGIRDICDIGASTSKDCNSNSVPDECDIVSGRSADCNDNRIADECEARSDCNDNAITDICDIADGVSTDCDANGLLDECEPDCNANLVADACDIAAGISVDANANGVPDECDFVVFVDAAATGHKNGTSWTNAYTDLQDAFADSRATEIWVAAGTYKPWSALSNPRAGTFRLRDQLAVYGGFSGSEARFDERDPQSRATILSGDLADDDALDAGERQPNDSCCNSHDAPGCEVQACQTAVCDILRRCCDDSWDSGCAYQAKNDRCCDLCATDNACDNSYRVVTAGDTNASAILDGFTITHGYANRQYGAINSGAGMHNIGGSPTIRNCRFVDNHTIYLGGAVNNRSGADPTFTNCMFIGNSGLGGGAMFNHSSSPTLINCVFTGNQAHAGGAIRNWPGGNPTLINCTLSANVATGINGWAGGIHSDGNAHPELINCIVWGNTHSDSSAIEAAQIAYALDTPPVVNYSCIQGWTGALGGVGNHGLNPGLVDANGPDDAAGTGDDNLRLVPGSPCIDAGSNAALPPDVRLDLDGTSRFVDDSRARNIGFGIGPPVDMGAYEGGVDCNRNGILDEVEIDAGTTPDCNENSIPDECDIADATSVDCDGNGIPDECDDDCNNNGFPDVCDINRQQRPDGNGNGVPDECEAPKNRYISFLPNRTAGTVAYRVELIASEYFPDSVGRSWWVDLPDRNGLARLTDTPVYHDWSDGPRLIQVGDCPIVPVATYAISSTTSGIAFSEPTVASTVGRPTPRNWGDVAGARNETSWDQPNGVVNADDVQAALLTFRKAPGAPPITWIDLDGVRPNGFVNVTDIQLILLAFQSRAYPFMAPGDCSF